MTPSTSHRHPGRANARWVVLAVVVALAGVACADDAALTVAFPRRVVGIAEVTFRNIDSPFMTASVRLTTSVADLERLRGAADNSGNLGVLQLEAISAANFSYSPSGEAPTRFLRASFGLRNAGTETPVFDPATENVVFVAVATANTVAQTPVRIFEQSDGLAANATRARDLLPTNVAAVDAEGALVTLGQDVLSAVTEEEIKTTNLPAGALKIFPYGFLVRRFSPGPGQRPHQFDGVSTFAYRIPDDPNRATRPVTISVLYLIVKDANTT